MIEIDTTRRIVAVDGAEYPLPGDALPADREDGSQYIDLGSCRLVGAWLGQPAAVDGKPAGVVDENGRVHPAHRRKAGRKRGICPPMEAIFLRVRPAIAAEFQALPIEDRRALIVEGLRARK